MKEQQVKIFPKNAEFPPLLHEIPDTPKMLYAKGNIPEYDRPLIAIVGTRVPSDYGIEMTKYFAGTLAEAGCVIVSGFARGIDSIAHKAVIEANGKTIAVLGCGLNHIYPPENKKLAEKLLDHGAFLTEFPEDMEPKPWNFVSRNRIIAGMCQATLVIEAPRKSGALITAQYANDYNRTVFAIPGNIGQKGSFGTNDLLKEGAMVATCPEDILEILNWNPSLSEKMRQLQCTEDEGKILALLENGTKHVDDIVRESQLKPEKISSLLTVLELKRLVCSEANRYRLAFKNH